MSRVTRFAARSLGPAARVGGFIAHLRDNGLHFGVAEAELALSTLAPQFQWSAASAVPAVEVDSPHQQRFVVVATQGQGDLEALKAALSSRSAKVAFVGSVRKFAALSKKKLVASGLERGAIDLVKAPAGLDVGAVTPEEIALSILAKLIQTRRTVVMQDYG